MPERSTNDQRHLKITVVLLQRHVAALDHLAVTMRLRSGIAVHRAHIVDALIGALLLQPRALVEEMIQKRRPASNDNAHNGAGAKKSNRGRV